jgi:hypothetical protein
MIVNKKLWSLSLLIVVGVIGFYVSFKAASNQFARGNGDTAFIKELVDSLGDNNGPYSTSATSTAAIYRTWSQEAEAVCAKTFEIVKEPLNYFKRVHPYFLMYSVAPFKNLVGSNQVLIFLMALSFFGLGFFLMCKLSIKGIPFLVSIALVHLFMSHPGWIGGLEGQVYFDRLFVFFGGLLFWYVLEAKTKIGPMIIFLAAIVALINDRTGIQAAVFVGGYGFLFLTQNPINKKFFALGIALFLFSMSLIYFYVQGYDSTLHTTSQIQGILGTISRWDAKILSLWAFAILILGPWSFENWRLLFIGFASLLPNSIISVGGAEKTGWVTHYHSGYLPVICVISAYCFLVGFQSATQKKKAFYLSYLFIGTLGTLGLSRDLSVRKDIRFSWTHSGFAWAYSLAKNVPDYEMGVTAELDKIIPKGVTVSASEMHYKFIWNDRNVIYFPSGIDEVDYILLGVNDTLPNPAAASSYLSQEQQVPLHKCLWEKVNKTHPHRINVPNYPFVVMKRKSETD